MGISEVAKSVGDAEEQGIELHWITLRDAKEMIRDGEIVQKNTLAAFASYLVSL